ncbi:MAG: Sporulation initiation phosphotransferase F [Deltaproteobacteria bacterium ADurb.Bin510]|nr:MAG: Sporulation initiation phosphotransferase F [Deltaproteobacteria bacterium ADurb.Bin510]
MAKRVLIVDDEETLTWSLARSLKRDQDSFEVTTASDGESALEAFGRENFDVVVLDIRMPGINGLDVLTRMKQEKPATRVIIMTAYGSGDIRAKAKAKGSFYYIEKPFDMEEMRGLIVKALKEQPDRGFNGSMSGLQLADLIQMNCLSQITTALEVKKDDREGTIYFEDGQITHARVDTLEGEEALFTILSWQSGSFRFLGGQKADHRTIEANWEYLLIEGMRKADEMSLALERGELDEIDIIPIDEQTRMVFKNLAGLNECKGLALLSIDGDVIHKSGSIATNVNLSFAVNFFLHVSETLADITGEAPEKISFIDQNRLVLVYPVRLYLLVAYFDRAVLAPDTQATIERIIGRYQA